MSVLIGMLNDLDHRGEAPQVGPGLLAAMDGAAAMPSLRAPARRPLWRRGALLAGLAAIGACALLTVLRPPGRGMVESPSTRPAAAALVPDASALAQAMAPAAAPQTVEAAPPVAARETAPAPAPVGAALPVLPLNEIAKVPPARAPAPAHTAPMHHVAVLALQTPQLGRTASPSVALAQTNAESTAKTAVDAPAVAPPGSGPLASVIRRSGSANDEAADLARAYELAGRGRTVEAIELLQRALRDWPRHLESRSALATLLSERGLGAEALVVLLDGVALDPGRFALTAARLQAQAQQPAAALATLTKVPEAQRDGPYHALVAAVAQRAARPDQAVAEFEAALAAGAPRALWYVGLGSSLEQLARSEAALAAYRMALAQGDASGAAADFARQRIAALAAPVSAPHAVLAPELATVPGKNP